MSNLDYLIIDSFRNIYSAFNCCIGGVPVIKYSTFMISGIYFANWIGYKSKRGNII